MPTQKSRILTQSLSVLAQLWRERRGSLAIGTAAMLAMVAASAIVPYVPDDAAQLHTVVERLAPPVNAVLLSAPDGFLHAEPVQPGDTLAALLARLGVEDSEAFDYLRSDATAAAVSRQLRPGKEVVARTTADGRLLTLDFPVTGKDATISIRRQDHGFRSLEQSTPLETRVTIASGEITSSLFGATDASGVPDTVAIQLTDIFGGDVDFYRDLRRGDRFSVVYEMIYGVGQPIRSGRILAAEFVNSRGTLKAFWFEGRNQQGAYYGADGRSLHKTFLRTPLEFSRITSGFSNRRFHPVLQTWRAHKGIDYGAPTGTQVRAVGDGVVEFAGRRGGYGNLLLIRHQGAFSTAYGHLRGFAAGIRRGRSVKQGEVVAYVGQTGLATGPHLHYEFRVNGQQVNPLAIRLPTALPLDVAQLPRFRSTADALDFQLKLAKQMSPETIN